MSACSNGIWDCTPTGFSEFLRRIGVPAQNSRTLEGIIKYIKLTFASPAVKGGDVPFLTTGEWEGMTDALPNGAIPFRDGLLFTQGDAENSNAYTRPYRRSDFVTRIVINENMPKIDFWNGISTWRELKTLEKHIRDILPCNKLLCEVMMFLGGAIFEIGNRFKRHLFLIGSTNDGKTFLLMCANKAFGDAWIPFIDELSASPSSRESLSLRRLD